MNRLLVSSQIAWQDRAQLKWLLPGVVDVAYAGWVGRKNLGDEAMFELHQSFKRCSGMNRIPLDRKTVKLLEVGRPRIRTLLIGGGTIICRDEWIRRIESVMARAEVERVVVLGAGVEDPAFALARGIATPKGVDRWVRLLQTADYIGVRGPSSHEALASLGLDSHVVGDPALAYAQRCVGKPLRNRSESPYILVNVANVADGFAGRSVERYREMSLALRQIEASGIEIRFFAMEPGDNHLARKVFHDFRRESFPRTTSLSDVTRAIQSARLVLSERLHGAILSASFGVPFLHLGYKPKSYDFANSIKYRESVIPMDDWCRDVLTSRIREGLRVDALPHDVLVHLANLRRLFERAHAENVGRHG